MARYWGSQRLVQLRDVMVAMAELAEGAGCSQVKVLGGPKFTKGLAFLSGIIREFGWRRVVIQSSLVSGYLVVVGQGQKLGEGPGRQQQCQG